MERSKRELPCCKPSSLCLSKLNKSKQTAYVRPIGPEPADKSYAENEESSWKHQGTCVTKAEVGVL